jgi:hypothetical protein
MEYYPERLKTACAKESILLFRWRSVPYIHRNWGMHGAAAWLRRNLRMWQRPALWFFGESCAYRALTWKFYVSVQA